MIDDFFVIIGWIRAYFFISNVFCYSIFKIFFYISERCLTYTVHNVITAVKYKNDFF